MISGLFFVNQKGEVVISRYFRDNVSRSAVDSFRHQIIAAKKFTLPIINIDKTTFLYMRVADVFFVAVTKYNANPAIIIQFMYKLLDVFRAYFGVGVLINEENIRLNFVIMYELFDECMDFGHPQITSTDILKTFIQNGVVKDANAGKEVSSTPSSDAGITSEITGNVDWRQAGKFRYRQNEVFIDVIESVNLLMSAKGVVLRSDVSGQILMKTHLTGMPECKFGLNDKLVMDKEAKLKKKAASGGGIAIDDLTFHRCVKLGQFDIDRTISFVPPDGEFDLMKYRITDNVHLPFTVVPVVTEHGRSRVTYEIKIKCHFAGKLSASSVVLRIPTPNNVSKWQFEEGIGRAKFDEATKCIVWKIKKFPGDGSFLLKGEVRLLVTMEDKQWSRPPITMDFQVPMFTSSGLHVRFLKVFERSNYETIKWVKYVTKAGQYQIRI